MKLDSQLGLLSSYLIVPLEANRPQNEIDRETRNTDSDSESTSATSPGMKFSYSSAAHY